MRDQIRGEVATWTTRPLVSIPLRVRDLSPHTLTDLVDPIGCPLYTNCELCIVDNASTDKEVRRFLEQCTANDARVKLSRPARIAYRATALNAGLHAAKGEFVAIMDGRDLVREHAL